MQLPNRHGSVDSDLYRYGFNGMEKDDEVKGSGNSYDFGNRIYDSRLMKWFSMDPLQHEYPSQTPYHFVSNSPIAKIDVDGRWDIEVHAYKDRAKYGYAVLIVKNRLGEEVYRTTVRVQGMKDAANGNNPRNRTKTYGDTPTGIYDIMRWSDRLPKANRTTYGPNDVLELDYISGEAKSAGRNGMHLHGGRQEGYNGNLWNTGGCMRIKDDELKEIQNLTQNMEADDPMEAPGFLTVCNDLIEVDGEYSIPIIENNPATDAKETPGNKSSFFAALLAPVIPIISSYFSKDETDSKPAEETPVEKIKKGVIIDFDGDGYTRMRNTPGGANPIDIKAGTTVQILEEKDKYVKIKSGENEGYILKDYIKSE